MTVTTASFRGDFPEFADTTIYSDAQVSLWLNFANLSLQSAQDRWADFLDIGTELLMAHNIAISAKAGAGKVGGPIASKSVGGVSASYDTSAVTIEGAGQYNMTSYGVRFLQMARMIGAGGVQL